jgi:hypothetical protein
MARESLTRMATRLRGERRSVICDCPSRECGVKLFVPFANPIDGGPPVYPENSVWHRKGETIDTLTLNP